MTGEFKIGDVVEKASGYRFPGVVVARFLMTSGVERLVVECTAPGVAGLPHIYAPDQLRHCTPEQASRLVQPVELGRIIADIETMLPRIPDEPWSMEPQHGTVRAQVFAGEDEHPIVDVLHTPDPKDASALAVYLALLSPATVRALIARVRRG